MNSPLPSEPSLYELALKSAQQPVVQLSPATFKSIVTTLIDLLIEQKASAMVWAKLPRGHAWQAEIDRYSLLSNLSKTIYLFKNQREDSADDPELATPAPFNAKFQRTSAPSELPSPAISISLAPENPIRREYFLFIWSTQFQGGVLAQRGRSLTASKGTGTSTGLETGPEEAQDKKPSLLTLCQFDAGCVEPLLGRLQEIACAAQLESGTDLAANPIVDWQTGLANMAPLTQNSFSFGQLFAKQLQKQEDLWHRSAVYRKQAETAESLQLQNEELVNAVRLKDEFLSNVGQELRTPLTTIKTALSLLNSPSLKQPQRQRYMELISKECDRQSSLITSLLNLVQLDQMADQFTLEPLLVSEVVPGVVSTYQPLAEEKGVMLAYTIPENLPTVGCAAAWLKQIVINLLHNGIKFTPRGGQVWVRAKQQGDFIQLEFRDTGIGIASSEIPKIFDRFYRIRQTSEDASGAGLGLTIVQQLLLHCGGSISVKSKLGEGTTFSVLLPIYQTSIDAV